MAPTRRRDEGMQREGTMVTVSASQARDVDLSDLSTWIDGPPHSVFEALRASAPVHWQPVEAGSHNGGIWSLTRYEHIAEVSRDKENFTITRGTAFPVTDIETFKEQMMQKDPPEHTRLRRIVSRGFSPRVVALFDTWVRDIVSDTLDRIESMDTFDFVAEVEAAVPALVISQVLGVPRERRADIYNWANGNFAAYVDAHDPDSNAKTAAAMIEYGFELRELKRNHPGDDIVTGLVNSPEQLTDEEYKGFFVLLLMAGFETTHTLMAQGMRAILENDYIADQVASQCNNQNSGGVVEEMLRYVSPVNEMVRCAKRDVVIGDQLIPEGDMVVMWYVSANRDPSVFDNPNMFDASRDPNPHMGFGGGGVHFCIGSHLARLEGRILFEELHRRNIRLRLAGDPIQPPNMFVNQLATLPVART
jgi:cholest-4-en-3-one 26-monooxygenase